MRAATRSKAEPKLPPKEISRTWSTMGRRHGYIVTIKGPRDLHESIASENTDLENVEGILGIEGSIVLKGMVHLGVMPLKLHEGPTLAVSSRVVCSGGTACLGPRMTTCVWVVVAASLFIEVGIGMEVARRALLINGTRG